MPRASVRSVFTGIALKASRTWRVSSSSTDSPASRILAYNHCDIWADPCHADLKFAEPGDQRLRLTCQLSFAHCPAASVHHAKADAFQRYILAGRTKASLAASTGVSTVTDLVKYLLAGADVVMTTSALLRHDIEYMSALANGLSAWMRERAIASLADMRGMMSWQRSIDRSVYTRANYLRILEHAAYANLR